MFYFHGNYLKKVVFLWIYRSNTTIGGIYMNIISMKNPKSAISESYRSIRTNIEFSNVDRDIKVIMVTSSKQNEGKSTVISNLAVTFASLENKRVLIIDGDLRNPTVHRTFNISNTKGLTDILIGNREFRDCICTASGSDVDILSAGRMVPNPSEVLGSTKMQNFLESIKEQYDYIFIDTPPIGIVTDAGVLSRLADGTILVVASKEVDIDIAKIAQDRLNQVNAKILGVILNKFEEKNSAYGYYGYYNESKNEKPSKKKKKAILGFNIMKMF